MGVPGSANPLLLATAQDATYTVSRSLRFNAPDSAYLSRTPGSAGNRKTWTWSGWVKRCAIGVEQRFFSASTASTNSSYFEFTSGDQLSILNYVSSSVKTQRVTTQVFRDPSAWYHIVVASNSSTSFNVYVNGSEVTTFASSTGPDASDWFFNGANLHTIGTTSYSLANYFSGYLANVEFVDGSALTPASFGETSATTGQWVPKAFSGGSYGTNGFKLDFADNSAATAAALGKDTSGNGNNWTPTNLSVAAGAGNDSLVDTPTSYGTDDGLGGSVRGNYCAWNSLDKGSNAALTNGNLDVASTTQSWSSSGVRGTVGLSTGKWYWEITCLTNVSASANIHLGIATVAASLNNYLGADAAGWAYTGFGAKYNNNSGSSYGVSNWVSSAIVGIALDLDNGTLTFYHNGVSQGQAYSGLTGSTYFPAISVYNASAVFNAGARPFAYTAPSGFKALCDTNLPTPVVAKPSTVFDTKLYTGNGSTQNITGLGFSPDLVWIKSRSQAGYYHILTDSARGTNKQLFSNDTLAEESRTDRLTAFNSDGFSLGSYVDVNQSTGSHVAWCWDAGSSNSTNTQGSITSTVRANASAGFSIVTYTGTGSLATVGHGLGAKPGFYVIKRRDVSSEWTAYHSALGATKYITLQSTAAAVTTANAWNNTEPTSSVLTINSVYGDLNANGGTYVIYAWAPLSGYSSFGSYTGNGSADGPFVYTGFRPRWLMIKCSSAAGEHWEIMDATRAGYNFQNNLLYANLSNAEETNTAVLRADLLSNGFKIRSSNSGVNTNTATYIWAAFAESPFAYSRAR